MVENAAACSAVIGLTTSAIGTARLGDEQAASASQHPPPPQIKHANNISNTTTDRSPAEVAKAAPAVTVECER